jgi:hypothetical protein
MRLRATLLAVLTLLMTVTGIGTAVARGGMAADGVICGTGAFHVVLAADGLPLFDAAGNPVAAEDIPCLDCVIGALDVPAHSAAPLPGDRAARTLSPLEAVTSRASLWRMGGMARSPPRAA